jgi:hypothetical protein
LRGTFGGGFFFSLPKQAPADFLRDIHRNRARVRLLLFDPEARQQVNDGFRFDLEFAGQLVDSDLVSVAQLGIGLFRFLGCFTGFVCRRFWRFLDFFFGYGFWRRGFLGGGRFAR